ncbi:AAA family ATPase [bacterium]|nr:AAA family ATPase [bacterium]
MGKAKEEKIFIRTESYSVVMAEAVRQAKARAVDDCDDVITPSDLFKAVCVKEPGVFKEILGDNVVLPCTKAAIDRHISADMRFSSELDRYLSPYGGVMANMLDGNTQGSIEISALNIAAALLFDPIPEVKDMLAVSGIREDIAPLMVQAAVTRELNRSEFEKRKKNLPKTYENISKIREYLTAHCFGQDAAIDAILTQISTAWGLNPAARGSKPLSFFLVGASGTGKSHLTKLLQEAFEEVLHIPQIQTIDFARFATEQMPMDLIGRDNNWKDGGREGELTRRGLENPNGIIVIDNYELGHPIAVSYLNTALEEGRLADAFSGKTISFANNIFIILTNNKEVAENDEFLTLVSKDKKMPPKDKLVEGLVKSAPKFKSTLALVDQPVLFLKHDFKSFFAVLKDRFLDLKRQVSETFDAECDFESEEVYRLLVGMHPQISSAHPIQAGLEDMVLMPIQNFLREHLKEFKSPRRIRIECDQLPAWDCAPEKTSGKAIDEAWLEELTKIRVRQATRLTFTPKVELAGNELTLRFTDIKHVVMPSIEDYGYFSVTAPNVKFSDLVGVEVVKERVQEALDLYSGKANGKHSKPQTGMILCGPPGTGKTSVAKAIANELGRPFIMVNGADFRKSIVGEGVESVKKLFAAARRYKAVIFIDEIDALGNRDTGSLDQVNVIDAFLSELDGFTAREMLVIGATNRYHVLDTAMVRKGRLSLKVELGNLCRKEDRRKLIELELKKIDVSLEEEIIQKLVETTSKWSPADIIGLINEGIRIAEKRGEKPEFKHFVEARTIVILGEDPQKQEGTPEEMYMIAVHEAGHAVCSVLRGIRFVHATIQGAGSVAGYVDTYDSKYVHTKKDLENMIDLALAGRAAENLLSVRTCGVESDFKQATGSAIRMLQEGLASEHILTLPGEQTDLEAFNKFAMNHRKELEQILNERLKAVEKLFKEHMDFLKAVADALAEKKLLLESEILAIKKSVEGEKVCTER